MLIWSCISFNSKGPIVEVKGIMNKHKYKDIFSKNLILFVDKEVEIRESLGEINPSVIFMDDNDPKQSDHLMAEFLVEQGINTLEWVSQSPDLNPIENVWSMLDSEVFSKISMYTKRADLLVAVQRCWDEIDLKKVQNCIDSMPRRIDQLIKNKGDPIDY